MVISASRTKDIVRNSPDMLASILKGERECRLSFAGKRYYLSLSNIHTLVLWTKSPFNILQNKSLFDVLNYYVKLHKGLIYLQLTVTGLGDSFIEYNTPHHRDVFSFMKNVFDSGLIFPESVKLRYDPYSKIVLPSGREITNMKPELFEEIISMFASIGIKNFTSSEVDFVGYPQVRKRIEGLGLKIIKPSVGESVDFVEKMDRICKKYHCSFSICCNPDIPELVNREGCIDGNLFNKIKKKRYNENCNFADVRIHNDVTGGQRHKCRCTYSFDIGYSKGFTTCYKNQSGCIYCYAQQNLNEELKRKITDEIKRLL